MQRNILFSFDVEEFDIPLEYNYSIAIEEQMKIGKQGLDALLPVVDAHSIRTTMFTTANFAQRFPEATKLMSDKHEIASHTFYHTTFKNEDLLSSRLKLEEIIEKPVAGLRMPRMRPVEMCEVIKAGYKYDSSINPTWLPGRYNNRHLPRVLYVDGGMKRLPASVSPHLRIPLFWLAFKNMPYFIFKQLAVKTLKKDGHLCLYFHPWEFIDINNYNLPSYVRRGCNEKLLYKLDRLIKDLKQEGDCMGMDEFVRLMAV